MPTSLPLLTTRLRQHAAEDESCLARQWRLLKLMIFSPKGFTIKELVALSGVSEKTVRRDLIFLKEVGFDVSETVEDFGRKLWRVRRLPEMSGARGTTREKYGLIRDSLRDLEDVARLLDDAPLAESLKRLRDWVEIKSQPRTLKPR